MRKALLWGCRLAPVLLLAGCQSSHQLLLPETAAYSSPCLSATDTARASLPQAADSTALTASSALVPVRLRSRQGRSARLVAPLHVPGQPAYAVSLSQKMKHGPEISQVRRARRQPFRFRHPQDETEGNPWLLTLGIILIAAGIVGGLLIGGGLGIFAGIVVGLLGYYFFMRGLLGPHAWLEAIQELFQL